MREPPRLDGRSSEEIHDDVVARVPGYVPQWTPTADPTGDAMATLFAEMAAVVASDLDGLPEKHFVSFLDRLGFDRLPPQRARLPLSVTVADGAGRNVVVPAGTRVTATGADGTEQTFEVTSDDGFEATPANLTAVYTTDPARDSIQDVLAPVTAGDSTPLFGGDDIQEHRLYVGHGELLTLDGGSRVLVEVETSASRAVFAETATWEFYGTTAADDTERWRPLTPVGERITDRLGEALGDPNPAPASREPNDSDVRRTDDRTVAQTTSPSRPVSVLLELPADAEAVAAEVDGVETMWIRATVAAGPTAPTDVFVSGLRLAVGPSLREFTPASDPFADAVSAPLTPDALFHNDVELPLSDVAEAGTTVFPFGETPQQRDVFAIASSEAFSNPDASVTLTFGGVEGLFDAERRLSWEYWNGDGWRVIPDYSVEGESLSFAVPSDLAATAVVGQESHWIRVRLLDTDLGQVTYRRIPREEFASGTNSPNQTVELAEPPIDEVSVYVEESTNGGSTWIEWHEVPDIDAVESAGTFFEVDEGSGTVIFGDGTHGEKLPAGMDNVKIIYWSGTYDYDLGEKTVPSFETLTLAYGDEATDVSLPATVTGPAAPRLHVHPPAHVVSYNNRSYETHDSPTRETALAPFRPFAGLSDETQAVYLGFDAPLSDGPLQLLVSVEEKLFTETFDPRIRWEYVVDESGTEWAAATVEDGTEGLTERGIVALSFAEPTVASHRFGADRHWVRAAVTGTPFTYATDADSSSGDSGAGTGPQPPDAGIPSSGSLESCESVVSTRPPLEAPTDDAPLLTRLTPNTGWASNVRSVAAEPLGTSDGTADQTFTLRSTPATNVHVEVDELATLSTSERTELVETEPERITERVDDSGEPTAVWVRWTAVDDLDASGPQDRHYTVDWATGTVRFGDGVSGRIPPVDHDVRASYETGGGLSGNVDAGRVERLVSSIAFVDSVRNPEAADGGVDAETTAQVRDRAPKELRDRNRAVTLADVERLALASSRRLARVTALSAMDRAGEYTPGTVTLVVVPRSGAARPTPSVELRRRVSEGVLAHAPATLSNPTDRDDRLVVRGPRFVSASVSASLVSERGVSRSLLESAAVTAIEAYLHPLTGGDDDTGWAFGDLPCLSDLYALLERVEGVDHVADLALTFTGDEGGAPLTVTAGDDDPSVAVDALVYSGDHDVSVTGAV